MEGLASERTCDESNEGVGVLCILHSIAASRAICLFAALRGVFRAREIMYSGIAFGSKQLELSIRRQIVAL